LTSRGRRQRRDMKPTTENKALYQRFYDELFNRGNLGIIDELVRGDVVSHSPFPGQEPGAAGFKKAIQYFRAAFPDLRAEGLDFIAEGEKVVGRFRITGTHAGEFMGKAPTGRSFAYDEIAIVRFQDGRIVEHWSVADTAEMLQQLGLAA
jgi:steroid delta-isomerase-like uncharacterized protein